MTTSSREHRMEKTLELVTEGSPLTRTGPMANSRSKQHRNYRHTILGVPIPSGNRQSCKSPMMRKHSSIWRTNVFLIVVIHISPSSLAQHSLGAPFSWQLDARPHKQHMLHKESTIQPQNCLVVSRSFSSLQVLAG